MRTAGYILGRMQYAPTGLWITSTDKEYYPCRWPGTFWDVCFCAPTGLWITSIDKEYYPCGGLGTCWGVCFCAPTGLWITSTDKEYYPYGQRGTYWGVCNTPLSGCDQLLPIKNITRVDGRIYAGAYAIRPYRVHNRYTQKGIITAHAKRFRFRFPILVRACRTVQISFPDFSPCMRNGSGFVFRFSIRMGNR